MKPLVAALLLLAVALAAAGDIKTLKTGDTVPSFTLKNYDGKEISLDAALKQNRYAVVMFIATRCPVSNAYNTRMQDLQEKFSGRKIAFIGINANQAETADEVRDHAKEHKFGFPVVKDPNNVIADAYGALVTPEIFVVDSARKLLYHGRIDDNRKEEKVESRDLANALDALLAGKPVSADQQRAFGCSIKRVEDIKP
jgi:peroxiredoxin